MLGLYVEANSCDTVLIADQLQVISMLTFKICDTLPSFAAFDRIFNKETADGPRVKVRHSAMLMIDGMWLEVAVLHFNRLGR